MADNKPLNWAYPFKAKAAEGQDAANATAELYQQALATAKDGFYPLGTNGLWHGGVHFDDETASLLDQSSIHCIADGEIIAYRIDDSYPTSQYSDGLDRPYSTGFVLVKHKLELPTVTNAASDEAGTEQSHNEPPAPSSPTESLTLYSLYMHLLNWNSYKAPGAPGAPAAPAFLVESVYSVKADKATDIVTGLRVRSTPNGEVAALLPKGCKVRTGKTHAPSPKWVELLEVLEGQASPALSGASLGWVYISEMEATAEANIYLIGEKANDQEPSLMGIKGLNVRKADNAQSAKMGQLPAGAKFRIEAGTGAYRKLLSVVEGQSIAPHTGNSIHNIHGYVHFDSLQSEQTQPLPNSVQVLAKPLPIKAGDLIGHMGQYQNYNDAQPSPRLHLEVFSCEDVPAFIAKSREVAKQLPADQKTLIKVHAGSSIKQPKDADTQIPAGADVNISTDSPKEGCWANVQQYAAIAKVNKANLGSYNSTAKTYPINAAQKSALAAQVGISASELADTVDFLQEYYDAAGGNPGTYSGGNIPADRPLRKIGVRLKTATRYWVERSQLNAQGQRSSTAGALQAWTEFPLTNANPGQQSGYDRILAGSSWAYLPATHKAIAADQTRWWYVTVGGTEGQDISGWVPEIDPIISKHSPWEWPGFSTIEDKTTLDAQCARHLDATQCATEEEQQTYAALIEEAERGPIFSKLYDIIDAQNQTGERDGKLTSEELRAALAKPWLAQSISQLITHHESEWYWTANKWNQLDSLMTEEAGQVNKDWEVEKQRIEKLCWWGSLADKHGLSEGGKVWNIHSSSATDIFKIKNEAIDIEKFITLYSSQHQLFRPGTPRLEVESKENLEKLLRCINDHLKTSNEKTTIAKLSYMLATARHESYHYLSGVYFSEKPEIGGYSYFNKYDPVLASTAIHRKRAKKNENIVEGDGFKYRGRGTVHLTWKKNYRKASEAMGVDFVNNPDLAAEFKYAVPIMFWGMNSGVFTGVSLSDFINERKIDYKRARAIINGSDADDLIASYALRFESILKESSSLPKS